MYEDRIAEAVKLHAEGFNCSQSVVAAFADLFGFTKDQALRLSASFGGGIGRMRETCGAACGMFILLGMLNGSTDGKDSKGKTANYSSVRELAAKFKKENGAMLCRDLLGLDEKGKPIVGHKKRPCSLMVETAAKIFADYLEKHPNP